MKTPYPATDNLTQHARGDGGARTLTDDGFKPPASSNWATSPRRRVRVRVGAMSDQDRPENDAPQPPFQPPSQPPTPPTPPSPPIGAPSSPQPPSYPPTTPPSPLTTPSSPMSEPATVPVESGDETTASVGDDGETVGPRWVGFFNSIGLGLTVVLTAQVLAAIAEGMALKRTEPQGLAGDVFHRLGYAFSSLGGTALLFLVVAVVLVSLPVILKAKTTDRQETTAAVTLGLAVVMAVVIGI